MKKKFIATIFGILALTSLAACSTALPSTSENSGNGSSLVESSSSEAESSKDIAQVYNVKLPTNVLGAYVSASTALAAEGNEVVLTVVLTNSDTVKLDSVKMNDTVLNGTADSKNANILTYRFLMPASDATISVNTSKIVIPAKDHKINVTGSDKVVFNGLAKEANTGDKVEFKVSVISGFALNAITCKAGETDVELKGDSTLGYSFTMPDADVTINTEVIGNLAKLTKNKEELDTSSYSSVSVNDFIDKFIDSDGTEYSGYEDTLYFRGGSTVKFIAKHHEKAEATHFYVGNVEVLPVELDANADLTKVKNEYSFVMPYGDCELKATMQMQNVKVNVNAEGLNVNVYTLTTAEDGTEVKTPVTNADVGSYIYIEAKPGENNVISNISYDCKVYSSSTGLATKEEKGNSKTDWINKDTWGTFKFVDNDTKKMQIPSKMYAGDLTINIEHVDNIYTDEAFLGSYEGVEWYTHKVFQANKTLSINKAGMASAYPSKLGGLVENPTANELTMNNSGTKRTLHFNGSVAAIRDGSNPGNVTDIYLFIKAPQGDITYDGYVGGEFDIVCLKDDNSTHYFYLDITNNAVVLDPTVTFDAGSKLSDAGAKFTVKDGEKVLVKVGYDQGSDSGEPVPFAGKKFQARYTGKDSYGDMGNINFTMTFHATNKTFNFIGSDRDGTRVAKDNVAFTYNAETREIAFTMGDAPTKATFNADFTKLTFTTSLKDGYDYNFLTVDKVANVVVE